MFRQTIAKMIFLMVAILLFISTPAYTQSWSEPERITKEEFDLRGTFSKPASLAQTSNPSNLTNEQIAAMRQYSSNEYYDQGSMIFYSLGGGRIMAYWNTTRWISSSNGYKYSYASIWNPVSSQWSNFDNCIGCSDPSGIFGKYFGENSMRFFRLCDGTVLAAWNEQEAYGSVNGISYNVLEYASILDVASGLWSMPTRIDNGDKHDNINFFWGEYLNQMGIYNYVEYVLSGKQITALWSTNEYWGDGSFKDQYYYKRSLTLPEPPSDPNPPSSIVFPLPQTGQTISYADGDDGAIRAGMPWPEPRFTSGTGAEADCIIDNMTGFMWPKNGNLAGGPMIWNDALIFSNTLNLCGHTDWHLPGGYALTSLYNAGVENQAIWLNTQGFFDVQPYFYASEENWSVKIGAKWSVNMKSGIVSSMALEGWPRYVWPVRSGKYFEFPDRRFTVNGDCVTDNITGLMWSKNANLAGQSVDWTSALNYANNLTLCGYSDWRLPNKVELESFKYLDVDSELSYEEWAKDLCDPFINLNGRYWSSNTYINTDLAWLITMYGTETTSLKTQEGYVWPVRGGVVTCVDNDSDGYGNPGNASCPNGSATDCNNNDPNVHPGASDNCNGIDDNCNGIIDENCNTPVSSSPVVVNDNSGATTVTFPNVLSSGDTTITTQQCDANKMKGLTLSTSNSQCVDIQTTATWNGQLEVCMTYDQGSLTSEQENALEMISCDGATPPSCEVLTVSSRDTVTNKLCALTTHFSYFAVGLLKDTDSDGAADLRDNCINVFNPDQKDDNSGEDDNIPLLGMQHYGDLCDPDFDNDGLVTLTDYATWRKYYRQDTSTAPAYVDLDGDNLVGLSDYAIWRKYYRGTPGP